VRKALEHHSVHDVLLAAKAICKFFKSSPKAARALREKQEALHLPTKTMKIDNKTRWGSAYKMMKRLCASRQAISACFAALADTRRTIPDDLTKQQWATMGKLLQVLRHLNEASEFVSQQHHPTVGVVMPLMSQLLNAHLAKNSEKEVEDDTEGGSLSTRFLRSSVGGSQEEMDRDIHGAKLSLTLTVKSLLTL